MSTPDDGGTSGQESGSDPAASGAAPVVPAGFVPQAELDKANARARSFQAQADKAKADADKALSGTEAAAAAMDRFNPAEIARQVQAATLQAVSIANESVKLKSEFPSARPEIYDGQFQSAEELRAAVTQSHNLEEQHVKQIREKAEADIRADYLAKHGVDLAPVAPPADNAGTGQVTLQDFDKMSFSERLALPDEDLVRLSKE